MKVKKNQTTVPEINELNTVSECPPCRTMPLIGDTAPAFIAETTQGEIHFPEDYKGKWVILFSHPSDFTPVCTTEFIMFAKMSEELKQYNTELIGLSVDSLSSHIAWLYTIQEQVRFHGYEHIYIPFPLVADLNMKIAEKYGMIHPNAHSTKTVRAVFFIDPNAIIRTILYYPASTGRNFDEIKRILQALQTADAFGVSTPADWHPGQDVILGAPDTLDKARAASIKNKNTSNAWFLSLDKLSEEKIMLKLKHKKADNQPQKSKTEQ